MPNQKKVTMDPTLASVILRISKELPLAFSEGVVEEAEQTLIEVKDTLINENRNRTDS